jgi:hypothetical protein
MELVVLLERVLCSLERSPLLLPHRPGEAAGLPGLLSMGSVVEQDDEGDERKEGIVF